MDVACGVGDLLCVSVHDGLKERLPLSVALPLGRRDALRLRLGVSSQGAAEETSTQQNREAW